MNPNLTMLYSHSKNLILQYASKPISLQLTSSNKNFNNTMYLKSNLKTIYKSYNKLSWNLLIIKSLYMTTLHHSDRNNCCSSIQT